MILAGIKASEIEELQKTRAIYVQELTNSEGNTPIKDEIKERIEAAEERIDTLMNDIESLEENKT